MLYSRTNIKGTEIVIWKLEESREELLSMLDDRPDIEDILSLKSESRILEKLATRVILKDVFGIEGELGYYPSGRPYILNSCLEIGISHTRGYVAVAIHPTDKIGLDIEQISDKVKRVKSRIVSEREYIDERNELIYLLLHWSAKEALFKVLGEEGVDYLNHLFISPFVPKGEGFFQAEESKTPSKHKFDEVYYKVEIDFVLVCLTLPK